MAIFYGLTVGDAVFHSIHISANKKRPVGSHVTEKVVCAARRVEHGLLSLQFTRPSCVCIGRLERDIWSR